MTTQTKSKGMKVKEGRTIITVPHLDEELTFAYPVKGPGTYQNVKKQIDLDKTPSQLYRPTTAETISLVYSAIQDKDNKYSQEILKILNEKYFWCFTKNRYVPHEGVYIRDDISDKVEEERFVPFGFKVGEQSTKEFERNPFVITNAGEEGAQKLAEIASELKKIPYVWSCENVDQEIERVTDLFSYWIRGRLNFDGYGFDVNWNGFAAGVQK